MLTASSKAGMGRECTSILTAWLNFSLLNFGLLIAAVNPTQVLHIGTAHVLLLSCFSADPCLFQIFFPMLVSVLAINYSISQIF